MLTNKLYDENLNPTELMFEFLTDIKDTGIYDVIQKYRKLLLSHEVIGFITSDLHCQSAGQIIRDRVRKRDES